MIQYGFNKLIPYLGGWTTTIIATVLFLIIIRVGFAFVLKIFRLNFDYRTSTTKWKKDQDKAVEKAREQALDDYYNGKHIFH